MALRLSVEEVLAQIRNVSPFISGITVSGGEATTQLPFLVALLVASLLLLAFPPIATGLASWVK